MLRRHPPLPRQWLMTDERMGEGLWAALARLPRGGGVIFRHYRSAERRAIFAKVAHIARRRRLVLIRAGAPVGRGEDGIHGRAGGGRPGLRTFPAHSRREAIAAIRKGAGALFVSPVFATRSHGEARPLGRVRFGLLTRNLRIPVIALGGMTARRAHGLRSFRIHGWAAIDAWL